MSGPSSERAADVQSKAIAAGEQGFRASETNQFAVFSRRENRDDRIADNGPRQLARLGTLVTLMPVTGGPALRRAPPLAGQE
jgi:hypothetical protein